MLQLGSGAAAASTMLRCSAPFFFWAAPFAGAKFAFYPLIPGLQLLRSARFRMEGGCVHLINLNTPVNAQRPAAPMEMCPARWVLERCRRFHLCDLRLSVAGPLFQEKQAHRASM